MNKKALYGLMVAVLLPLIGYLWVKTVSERSVTMPRHFIYDSVTETTSKGKLLLDTVWHPIPDFTLTNQLGKKVSLNDFPGKIIVADFFFTHCPSICPTLTTNMKKLRDGIKSNDEIGTREPDYVQFLSFSIDPERDSVAELKKWADRFQVNPYNWNLLTGNKKTIYDLAIHDMKLLTIDGGHIDSDFVHTDIFVLIDRHRNIRGYYHTLTEKGLPDTTNLSRLSHDIVLLSLEKEKHEKFFLAGKLELIAVVFVLVAIGLVILFSVLKKESRKL